MSKPIGVSPQPTEPKQQIHPTPDPDSPSGVLIPATIEEAVAELEKMLHPDLIEEIRNETESEFLASQHFELGLWIRLSWRLWRVSIPNKLIQCFQSMEIHHPDAMSSFLLIALWHHLQQHQPN